MKKDFQILLFYCYAEILDTEKFKTEHHLFCIKNNIKGRIIISSEGINGTVSGSKKDCDNYRKELISNKIFSDIERTFFELIPKLDLEKLKEVKKS